MSSTLPAGGSGNTKSHASCCPRIFVSADGRNYVEARYADLRQPSITLWEQRAAVRAMRAHNQPRISQALIFQAIAMQRQVIERAKRDTRRVRAGKPPFGPDDSSSQQREPVIPALAKRPPASRAGELNYDKPVQAFNVEIWP